MAEEYGDLFAVEVAEEAGDLSAVQVADLVAEMRESHDSPASSAFCASLTSEPWFSIAIITVPDLERWPLPAEFSANKVPVDLAGLEAKSMAETRALITETLPDDQLETINEAELKREKPRQAVLKCIHAERERRGPGFANWVAKQSLNPLTCRIAGIAWGVTAGSLSLTQLAPVNAVEEAEALGALVAAFDEFRSVSHLLTFPKLAALDVDWTMKVIGARRIALGLDCDESDFKPVQWVTAGNWLNHIEAVGSISNAAHGFGIQHQLIPYVPELMEVYCTAAGSVDLSDWAASKLLLELDLLRIISRI